MSLVNLADVLRPAARDGYAVAAFNIINFQSAQAIVRAAEAIRSPLILQTSVSTVKAIGAEPLIAFLRQMAESATVPVALHLDHCTDIDLALRGADLGWTSIMIDLSKQPFQDNLRETARVAAYCHARGVSVEGELGAIFGVEDHVVVSERDATLADPDYSEQYCRETGVDAFAPAVGTAHGLYKGTPKVEFDRLRSISDRVDCPTVIHGGTGLSDEAFRRCIANGAAKINISTALKIAWCQSQLRYLQEYAGENDPLASDAAAMTAVAEVAVSHMRLFGCAGKVE